MGALRPIRLLVLQKHTLIVGARCHLGSIVWRFQSRIMHLVVLYILLQTRVAVDAVINGLVDVAKTIVPRFLIDILTIDFLV